MTLKEKSKTYSFWISLVSAALILVKTIAEYFGAEINHNLVLSIATGICGILVIVGLLSGPKKQSTIEELAEESKLIEKEVNNVNQTVKEDIENAMQNMTIEEQLEFLKNSQNQAQESLEVVEEQPEETLAEVQTSNDIENFDEVADDEIQIEEEVQCENNTQETEQCNEKSNVHIGDLTKEELKELLVLILEKFELI